MADGGKGRKGVPSGKRFEGGNACLPRRGSLAEMGSFMGMPDVAAEGRKSPLSRGNRERGLWF